MTSMFWTVSSACAAIKKRRMLSPPFFGSPAWLQVFSAVARRDALFLRVLRGVRLDLGAHQLAIGLHPVGDHLPLGAVPLLELDQARALVVHARDLERRHEARGAELLQALLVEVQVLDAPAHLLAGDRLALAVLRLRQADGLDRDDAGDDA